jgi:hypothetical protein
MRRSASEYGPWLLLGGGAGVGLLLWAISRNATVPSRSGVEPERGPAFTPRILHIPKHPYTDLDVEAAARMLASENPTRGQGLHIEQVWSQLRWLEPGRKHRAKSLYERITAGSGWGEQGHRKPPGGVRPVATREPATNRFRKLAEEVLEGLHPSRLPGATKFFEPAVQDRAFALGEKARKRRAAGERLTDKEKKFLAYHSNAEDKRKEWLADGSRFVGELEGLEFFT